LSEIRANTISDAAGTGPATLTGQYAAKAWVNFNGTGTVAIRQSGNVASITDTGTGAYTINFSSAFANANYFASVTPSGDAVAASLSYESNTGANRSNALVGSFALQVTNNNGTPADRASVNSGFIGDLA
jgi:hypothetical protein